MTTEMGPGLRRRQLADELTKLRTAARITTERVASVLRCSRARVNHLESGRNLPKAAEVQVLAALYGAPERTDDLMKLWDEANVKGWWDTYHLPTWMQAYVGLENDAVSMQCFALELVPGLLQTEGYARDALESHGSAPAEVTRDLQVRMGRQNRLGRLPIVAAVSEALLARTAHMGAVGKEQLDHLLAVQAQRVILRVLPFTAGTHRSRSGSFTLFEFPPGSIGPVAYQEYAIGGHLVDDSGAVRKLQTLYADLLEKCLDEQDSADMVRQYVL